jgi:DNA invertase Pin-like site-specific DNA recombinase
LIDTIVTGFLESNLTYSAGEGTITGRRVGDTRVSTLDQNTARQLDGVVVDRTFTDSVSGKDVDRPQLAAMLAVVREGEAVIVHSMDRLPRPR